MTVSSWDELTSLARAVRVADWFDEEERDYKFEIARRLKSALETVRDGGDWLARLESVFRLQSYNLTNWRQNRWFLDWGHESTHLGEVVEAFLDAGESAVERFDRFAQLAETEGVAKGNAASVLAFGSLFNFAVEPEALPLVRARVFEAVERRVGSETAASATPTERYEHHLRFAQDTHERMRAAGVPIRDMVDVQGVLFVLSQEAGDQLQRLAEQGHEAVVEAWDARRRSAELVEEGAAGAGLLGDVSREAVLAAISEFDELGREPFLEKHGFGRALKYVLLYDGKAYDSKAIYGVAYGIDHPDHGPLRSKDFTGGEHSVVRKLERLGFEVRTRDELAGVGSALHLLLRWSAAQEPRTIDLHREVLGQHGAVWWGKIGDPTGKAAIAARRLQVLRHQLAEEIPTFVYLHRTGELWRSRLLEIASERPEHETQLIPDYYRDLVGGHHLWLKLAEFEQLPPDYAEQELVLDGSDDPESIAKAFKGQAALLYVRSKTAMLQPAVATQPRGKQVWWVNQGKSLDRSRAGGYLWAPKLTKDGNQRLDWDALSLVREGDLILNYANGSIRAVSSVTAEAVDATRPDPAEDKAWSDEGRRLEIVYRDLVEPIALSAVPVEWRLEEDGPFDKNGSIKQGYLYCLSDAFVSRLAGRFLELGLEPSRRAVERLTVEAVKETAEAERYALMLDDELYATLVAALESEKHVILTGPPGTAKTTLAQVVAETAQRLGLCDGYLLTTATADWTTYETIGGLKPKESGRLEFEPGHFLKAIEERQWLVIDELNRSQFDRAFGQLFTVLSGQPVTLPYSRPNADTPLSLLPEGVTPPKNAGDTLQIPREWRIVATMNVFDKSLLFEMSYALMRRFAFVEVPSPPDPVFEELIELWAEESEEAAEVAKDLLSVRQIKDIGPAVYRDIAHFAAQRLRLGEADESQLRFQAFYSYLLPQFEGIDDERGGHLLSVLSTAVGSSFRAKIRETLNTVLGLELAAPRSAGGEPSDESGGAVEATGELEEGS